MTQQRTNQKLPNNWNPNGLERVIFKLPMSGSINVGEIRRNLGAGVPDGVVLTHIGVLSRNGLYVNYDEQWCVNSRLKYNWNVDKDPSVEWKREGNLYPVATYKGTTLSYNLI